MLKPLRGSGEPWRIRNMARQVGTGSFESLFSEFDLRPLSLDTVSGLDPVSLDAVRKHFKIWEKKL